jgi:serine/threonine protein kinase
MGAVYEAVQPELDRRVALKVLPSEGSEDVVGVERFRQEARLLAKFDHPHIVRVHNAGHERGLFFLVMELVDGANLRELIGGGRLPPDDSLRIACEICEAVAFAHEQGIVHRDLKPENILVDDRGRVKIVDFGIAKWTGADRASSVTLTGTDVRIGTPRYMAPEQSRSDAVVDEKADIYALGVVFYELLTGEAPQVDYLPPSKRAKVDRRWDLIVARCLKADPAQRYASVTDLHRELRQLTGQPRWSSGRAGWQIVAAILVLATASWGLWPQPPEKRLDSPLPPAPTAPVNTNSDSAARPDLTSTADAAPPIAAPPPVEEPRTEPSPEPSAPTKPVRHPILNGNFGWTEPEPLGPEINTSGHEAHPTITSDGLTLLYVRNFETLYQCTRDSLDEGFHAGQPVAGPVNDHRVDSPFISADGLVLWFASSRPGSAGKNDLWESRRSSIDAPFEEPVNLGPTVNTADEESTPAVTHDGRRLFFSRRPNGDPADLFMADRADTSDLFGPARPLPGNVNSPEPDFFPRPYANGQGLFVATTGPNPGEQRVRLVRRQDEPFAFISMYPYPPRINVGLVSAIALFDNDRSIIFDTDRTDGMGGFDLWQSRRVPR